jgi:hypothetical protein
MEIPARLLLVATIVAVAVAWRLAPRRPRPAR